MKVVKRGQFFALVLGIAALVILSYNVTVVFSHGAGHGGGHGGGGHHGGDTREHHAGSGQMHDGKSYHHYHHHHDDYGDHYHNCRDIEGGKTKGTVNNTLSAWSVKIMMVTGKPITINSHTLHRLLSQTFSLTSKSLPTNRPG